MGVDYGRLPPSTISHPRITAENRELLAQIHSCLAKLSKADCDLLTRRILNQEEYVDIAAVLKITENQAYVNVCRARRRLVECLARDGIKPSRKKNKPQDSAEKGVS
jgi:DNA-directed RNA polymerase specialized sigma24 family protein